MDFPSFALLLSSSVLYQCSLGVGSAVAWKEAALGVAMRNILLLVLALVSVFEKKWMVWGVFAAAVVPQSVRRYDTVTEPTKAHTFLPSGMLVAGGDIGICTSWMILLLDKNCL